MTPELSICTRATRADYLPEAIESALAQTFTNIEVVVADDAGDLAEVAARFDDPRVRYHRLAAPHGPTEALVHVFELARGNLIAALDDDDVLLPGFAATAVERFRADPSLGVVFTNHIFRDGARTWSRRTLLPPGRYEQFLEVLLGELPVAMSAAVIRREVWEQVRTVPFSPDAPPDAQLWIRAALSSWPFEYVDEPLMVSRRHPRQVSALGSRGRKVALWRLFEFADPVCERLRRSHLAAAEVAYAAELLRAKRPRQALAAIDRARAAQPSTDRLRRWALSTLARMPFAAGAATLAWDTYRRVRPYRDRWSTRADRRGPTGRRRNRPAAESS